MENAAMLFTPIELCMTNGNQTNTENASAVQTGDFMALFIEQMKQQASNGSVPTLNKESGEKTQGQVKGDETTDENSLSMMAALALMNGQIPNLFNWENDSLKQLCYSQSNLSEISDLTSMQNMNLQNDVVSTILNQQNNENLQNNILELLNQASVLANASDVFKEQAALNDTQLANLLKQNGAVSVKTKEMPKQTNPEELFSVMKVVNTETTTKTTGENDETQGQLSKRETRDFSTDFDVNVENSKHLKPNDEENNTSKAQKKEKLDEVEQATRGVNGKEIPDGKRFEKVETVELEVPEREKIGEYVKSQVEDAVKQNKESVVMKLSPRELGDITVKISKSEGKIEIQFISSVSETAKLLENSQKELVTALKATGTEVQITTVSQSSQSGLTDLMSRQSFWGRQEQGQGQRNSNGYFFGNSQNNEGDLAQETVSMPTPRSILSMYA